MAEPSRTFAEVLSEIDSLLRLHNLASRALRRQDDNDPHFQILVRLCYTTDGRLSQPEMADALQLSTSVVQKVSASLQDAGFVRREEGAPRGGVFIAVTEAGKEQVRNYLAERARGFQVIQQLVGGEAPLLQSSPVLERLLADLKGLVVRRSVPLRAAS